MTKHVLLIAMLAAAPFACTKTNPALCCTDEANCESLGISDDHMCSDGLVCLGNQCVAETCASNTDCNAAEPFCATSQLCQATCDTSFECPGFGGSATDTICSSGACVQCVMSTDCSGTTPVCNTSSNTCVQCVGNSDCSATDPVCSNNICVGCGSDSDCASNVCGSGGSCVDTANIVYLDPTGSDTGTCTMAAPCRTLSYGASKTTATRDEISLAQGTYNDTFNIETATTAAPSLDIHGHGAAFISNADGPAYVLGVSATIHDFTFDGGGARATLTLGSDSTYDLENVEILDGAVGLNSAGTVIANRLTIHDSGYALQLAGSLTADQVIIRDSYSGIAIQGQSQATLQLTNAMIFGISSTIAVDLTNIDATIAFSTIVSTFAATPSTVNCPDGGTVRASIIWAPGGTVAPINGCNLSTSIVGPTTVSGATNEDPQFVNAAGSDYHLSSTSPAIDQVDTGPAVDFEGDSRPQGARYDIGADEYKP